MRNFTQSVFRAAYKVTREALALAVIRGSAMLVLWLCSPGGREALLRLVDRFRKYKTRFDL